MNVEAENLREDMDVARLWAGLWPRWREDQERIWQAREDARLIAEVAF